MKKYTEGQLASSLKKTLNELKIAFEESDLYFDLPQDSRFGDLTTNAALKLSRQLKKSPRQVAEDILPTLKKYIGKSRLKDSLAEIKIEGAGFINFYFKREYFYSQLREVLLKGPAALKSSFGKGRKVLLEFVSANPTGPLSVAHARQAAVGDILSNILGYLGFRVKREYYLNDEGNQINILGRSVELRQKELSGQAIEFPEDHYQGDYIYDIAKEAAKQKIETSCLKEFAASYILDIIKKELDDFGVKFDSWYSQKALAKSGKIEPALKELKKRGFIYEQDGATWFKSTSLGDDKDRVIIKSDGSYTYLTPDIAYHREKYRRGFGWLINLWGPDHHGYINRLRASVSALGHRPESLSIIIVQLATIFRQGKPVQMSTRRGQYITLREVLDEVGKDASRFFFAMRRTSSHLDFDLDVAKKQTPENPVYYIQYAHARICSILKNYPQEVNFKKADLTLLAQKEEIGLIKKICQFFYILNICYVTVDPYMLTVYLQELSEAFHKFYDLHRVLGQEEKLTQARLCLLWATKSVLSYGLKLMGVAAPEKM